MVSSWPPRAHGWWRLTPPEEKLVPDGTWDKGAEDLQSDLSQLLSILEDKKPAFVLCRLDSVSNQWLFVSYVPDNANVRDKVFSPVLRI